MARAAQNSERHGELARADPRAAWPQRRHNADCETASRAASIDELDEARRVREDAPLRRTQPGENVPAPVEPDQCAAAADGLGDSAAVGENHPEHSDPSGAPGTYPENVDAAHDLARCPDDDD